MDRVPPDYFDDVQNAARKRWDQLEGDPDLAAPWHQLFRQVQSPTHVISELLQNADDARATWARAYLQDGVFYFEHNGIDFDKESFKSLCRFGFSNKRHLHTIGFRGLGFKSTFSLGSRVELLTPTLAVAFENKRFTQPMWLPHAPLTEQTVIRIATNAPEEINWINDNITKWQQSPLPLLFFRHLQKLEFAGNVATKTNLEQGPVPGSEWIKLQIDGRTFGRVLHVRSEVAEFPPDAVQEIRQERADPDFTLPPCQVELVWGLAGDQRLYIVLPSEVQLHLPFSANAPFIQDPARTGIKHPLNSLTNRWLLRRLGKLAASTVLRWLGNHSLNREARVQAYQLIDSHQFLGSSLSMDCSEIVRESFREGLRPHPVLLTHNGELKKKDECYNLPPALFDVWSPDVLIDLFTGAKQHLLAPEVSPQARQELRRWNFLDRIDGDEQIKARLSQEPYPPRPEGWGQLIALWAYIDPLTARKPGEWRWRPPIDLAIVPVKNRRMLQPAEKATTMSAKDRQPMAAEWEFLGKYILIVDPQWSDLLRRVEKTEGSDRLTQQAKAAVTLFEKLRLNTRVGVEIIVRRAAEELFNNQDPGTDGIILAHIAARLDVPVPPNFQFLCQDKKWRPVAEYLLAEAGATLETLLPDDWLQAHLIHTVYTGARFHGNLQNWREWVRSEKSGLREFVLPEQRRQRKGGFGAVEKLIAQRGGTPPSDYPLKSDAFAVDDFDFDDSLWRYWEKRAASEPNIWSRLVKQIARDWNGAWEDASSAAVYQLGHTRRHALEHDPLTAAWVEKLRIQPCLPDTYGTLHVPAELYRHTAETAPLDGVESFVHPDYDRPTFWPLLNLLGVRTKPASADSLVDRIRALAQSVEPPTAYLFQLYRALDRVMARLQPEQLREIRRRFRNERLILAGDGSWQYSSSLFQKEDNTVPGALLIHGDVADLLLWDRLGVPRRPTLDRIIEWLQTIRSESSLNKADLARVRAVMKRESGQVWTACRHWLDLTGRWVPIGDLTWTLAESSLSKGLFPSIRQATADISMLSIEDRSRAPFTELQPLEKALEMRVTNRRLTHFQGRPGWIKAVAETLLRIVPESEAENDVEPEPSWYRSARRLLETQWRPVKDLTVYPYLNGKPAGSHRSPQVMWKDTTLYVLDNGPSHHRALVEEIASQFDEIALKQAITDCVAREPAWIQAYLAASFTLRDAPETTAEPTLRPSQNEPDATVKEASEPVKEASGISEDDRPAEPPEPDEVPAPAPDREPPSQRAPSRQAQEKRWALHRFMLGQGFSYDAPEDRYLGKDGSRITHERGAFSWVWHGPDGQLKKKYWVGPDSLNDGLEIPAEVWELLQRQPAFYVLLMKDAEGNYRQYDAETLQAMLERGEIELFPATYRLRRL